MLKWEYTPIDGNPTKAIINIVSDPCQEHTIIK